MLKKILEIFLCSVLILPCMPARGAEMDFILNEVYDNYKTNEENTLFTVDGGTDARVAADGREKFFYARAWDEDVSLVMPVKTSEKKVVVSGKVKVDGKKSNGELFGITDSSNSSFALLKISENGELFIGDGKSAGGYLTGKWISFDFILDFNQKKMTLIRDGKVLFSERIIKNMDIRYFDSLKFEIEAPGQDDETDISLDDLRVYASDNVLPDSSFPQIKYNEEILDYTPTIVKPSLGSYVFCNYNFDGGTSVLTPFGQTKISAVKENGNGYALFAREGEVYNAYADWYLSDEQIKIISRTKGLVVELDVMPIQMGTNISLLSMRSTTGRWTGGFSITTDCMAVCGKKNVKIPKNVWTKLGLIFDYQTNTVGYYVNGEQVSNGEITFKRPKIGSMRIDIPGSGGDVKFGIDNMKVYEENCLKQENNAPADDGKTSSSADKAATAEFHSAMETVYDAQKYIGDSVVVMLNSNKIYANGKKEECSVKPYVSENGRIMMPVRMISEKFGFDVEWNDENREITVNNNIKMKIGEKKIFRDGKEIITDSAPEIKDGRTFLPLRALCEDTLGKHVSWDERRMAIISDEEFPYTDSEKIQIVDDEIDTIFRYMQFDRPSGEEIEKLILENCKKNEHPRLVATNQMLRELKEKVENNIFCAEYARAIIDRAEYDYNMPVVEYKLRDGQLLPVSWTVQERIERWTTAFFLTEDRRYADRAWKEIEASAAFKDWNDNAHFLDVAEMANAYALAYDAFYNVYTEEQKKLMRDTLFEKAFKPALKAYSGTHRNGYWIKGDDNWTMVCPAGILVAALTVFDDGDYPETCKILIGQTVQSIEYVMGLFYPDGAWYESMGYLTYTMHHLAMGIGALMNMCGGESFNFLTAQGFDNVGNFFLHMQGPAEGGFNYHDGGTGFQDEEMFIWYAKAMNQPEFMKGRMSLARLLANPVDAIHPYGLLLYEPQWDTDQTEPALDAYYFSADTGTMRHSWNEKNDEWVGVHAGRNHIDHDNLDLGEFIYESEGIRWIADIGVDRYSLPGYFSIQGYNIYSKRPEGNNCLCINPREGYFGQYLDAYAPLTRFESGEKSALMVVDLSDAYRDDAASVTRGYLFSDNRRTLLVRDEIDLLEESDGYFFMHTKADIETDGKTATLSCGGKKLKVLVYCDAEEWELCEMKAEPFPTTPVVEGQRDWIAMGYKKLTVKFHGDGKVNLAVKLIPVKDGVENGKIDTTPIADWKITD